jgi:hypothetical protein
MEPTIGHIYTVAGRGEMKLDKINPNSLELLSHGNYRIHCPKESLVKEATQADLDARDAQAYPRNAHCQDPQCWCNPVIRPPLPPPEKPERRFQITHGTCTCGHQVTVHTYEDAGQGHCRVPNCSCQQFKETI